MAFNINIASLVMIRSLVILLLVFISAPWAASKTVVHRVGIMPFSVNGLTETEAKALTDRFRNELHALSKFNIMEQEKMESLLEEKEFQKSDICNEIECFVDIGNMIGVNRMILGKATKIGRVISLSIRVVDVNTGKIIRVVLEDSELSLDKLLIKVLPGLAEKIGGKASVGNRVFDIKDKKREPIAVLKLDANGITGSEAEGFTDRLRTELFKTNMFDVMEREKMANILEEQDFQQSENCDQASCLVQVGQLIGVRYIVGGGITRIGKFLHYIRSLD